MHWNKSRLSLMMLFVALASFLVGHGEQSWRIGLVVLFVGTICAGLVLWITIPSWRWKRFEASCKAVLQITEDRS